MTATVSCHFCYLLPRWDGSKVMDEGRSLLGQMAGNGRTLTKVRGAGAD